MNHRQLRWLCFALVILGFPSEQGWGQSWSIEELSPLPEPVTNNAVVEGYIGDTLFLYSFGGLDSTKLYSGIHLRSWRYNVRSRVWNSIDPLPDTLGKIASGASRIGDIIYIIGGYHVFENGSERSSDRVHRYDILNNRFLPDGAKVPIPIDDHVQAVWRDSLIFIVTGWSDVANVPNVQIYNPSSDSWSVGTSVPNNGDYAVFGASGTIVGDTIYYFGGARMGFRFPISSVLRKGIINPSDPTEITWSDTMLGPDIVGYRMGATAVTDRVFWLGGSDVTYNYNGIAYNGSGGVSPSNRSFSLSIANGEVLNDTDNSFPMDIRGVAIGSEGDRYLIGGIGENQQVSDKTLKIQWLGEDTPVEEHAGRYHEVSISLNLLSDNLNVSLQLTDPEGISIELYDVFGRQVWRMPRRLVRAGVRQFSVPMNYSPGLYFLNVKVGERAYTNKVVWNK